MSVLIRNGRVVTAADDYRADVFVDGETVALIGSGLERGLEVAADRVIDATGKLVLPGGVDPHTHMEMPFGGTRSSDTFETGTRAAAFGGTTSIVDFAIQTRGASTIEGLDTWHAKAEGNAAIDYAFHMIVTDLPDERVPELRRLADEGVTSYKLFMAYPGVLLVDDATIFRAMRKAGEDGTLVCMHAENGVVIDELVKLALAAGQVQPKYHALTRPTRLEGEGAHRALAIAEVARAPVYIVHLSCRDALTELRRAQERGGVDPVSWRLNPVARRRYPRCRKRDRRTRRRSASRWSNWFDRDVRPAIWLGSSSRRPRPFGPGWHRQTATPASAPPRTRSTFARTSKSTCGACARCSTNRSRKSASRSIVHTTRVWDSCAAACAQSAAPRPSGTTCAPRAASGSAGLAPRGRRARRRRPAARPAPPRRD